MLFITAFEAYIFNDALVLWNDDLKVKTVYNLAFIGLTIKTTEEAGPDLICIINETTIRRVCIRVG